MKRYLVYLGKKPLSGVSASDYYQAMEKARNTDKFPKSKIRVRLARKGTLLGSLANMSDYQA